MRDEKGGGRVRELDEGLNEGCQHSRHVEAPETKSSLLKSVASGHVM